jgi:RNA polymerase sigma factor (sigma-70 family)
VSTVPVGDLVTQARGGDPRAWDALVDRYLGMVHAICRGHHLRPDDAADVNQVVWLRLVEHLDRIQAPDAVGGWIAATTRNECLRVRRVTGRTVPTGDEVVFDAAPAVSGGGSGHDDAGVDTGLLVYERDRRLMAAFARLGERCQQLLRLLMTDPRPSYDEIGAALGMPVGSIGPTRRRCLERLRDFMEDDAATVDR